MAQINTVTIIEERLRNALEVSSLEIIDESHLHEGHPGAASGGGHYQVLITASEFKGLNLIQRHRLIYEALGDAMNAQIHALSIKASTPDDS